MTTANGLRVFSSQFGFPSAGSIGFQNHVIDASNEAVAWVTDARSTEAVTHVGFRYGARTGTPPAYIVGIEGVSTSTANPDGTYKTNGGNCSAVFTPPASTAWDGLWQWVALDNSYSPSLGEVLALTVRYSSGTIDVSNNSSFTSHVSELLPAQNHFPYALRNVSGTWATQATARASSPVFGIRTASLRYGPIIQNTYTTRTASTVGHRIAAKVNLPGGFGDSYRVIGIRVCAAIANGAAKNPLLKIWSASSALTSKTLDSDNLASTSSNALRTVEYTFASAVDLDFGTDYYFGFEVADATNAGIGLYGIQFSDANDKATDDGGAYIALSTYNGSAWTDDTTVRPWMELIVDDWTEPSGGGGLVAPIISGSGGLIIR